MYIKFEENNNSSKHITCIGSVTLLFSTTTGKNLNFPTTPGII
jgi:hypothetical protein